MWEANRWYTFSLVEALLWIIDSFYGGKQVIMLKQRHIHKMLIDELRSWIIVMFLSTIWTLILTAPIHYEQI